MVHFDARYIARWEFRVKFNFVSGLPKVDFQDRTENGVRFGSSVCIFQRLTYIRFG